jgi:hypothetical protein
MRQVRSIGRLLKRCLVDAGDRLVVCRLRPWIWELKCPMSIGTFICVVFILRTRGVVVRGRIVWHWEWHGDAVEVELHPERARRRVPAAGVGPSQYGNDGRRVVCRRGDGGYPRAYRGLGRELRGITGAQSVGGPRQACLGLGCRRDCASFVCPIRRVAWCDSAAIYHPRAPTPWAERV